MHSGYSWEANRGLVGRCNIECKIHYSPLLFCDNVVLSLLNKLIIDQEFSCLCQSNVPLPYEESYNLIPMIKFALPNVIKKVVSYAHSQEISSIVNWPLVV